MMPKYKLTYFNFRARAELARLIFAVADVDYEDERIQPCEWLQRKKKCIFGQLPIMTVDGEQICQSHAIARYLAREFGLAGKTNMEMAKCDMIVDCVNDTLLPISPAFREKNMQKKMEMQRNYIEELPMYMEMMEKHLRSNNNGDHYFVGEEMTWADLCVMNLWHWIPGFGIELPLDDYPKLKAHKARIEAHPRVADWFEQRPETPV